MTPFFNTPRNRKFFSFQFFACVHDYFSEKTKTFGRFTIFLNYLFWNLETLNVPCHNLDYLLPAICTLEEALWKVSMTLSLAADGNFLFVFDEIYLRRPTHQWSFVCSTSSLAGRSYLHDLPSMTRVPRGRPVSLAAKLWVFLEGNWFPADVRHLRNTVNTSVLYLLKS